MQSSILYFSFCGIGVWEGTWSKIPYKEQPEEIKTQENMKNNQRKKY